MCVHVDNFMHDVNRVFYVVLFALHSVCASKLVCTCLYVYWTHTLERINVSVGVYLHLSVCVCINAENAYVWINSQVALMRLHTSLHNGDEVINSPSQPVNKHLLPSDTLTHKHPFRNIPEPAHIPPSLAEAILFSHWPSENSKCHLAHHTGSKHLLRAEAQNCCFHLTEDVNEKQLIRSWNHPVVFNN